MNPNNYNEQDAIDLSTKLLELTRKDIPSLTMSEFHEISEILQRLDDSYEENIFYKIGTAKYTPYFLEKFKNDELDVFKPVLDQLQISPETSNESSESLFYEIIYNFVSLFSNQDMQKKKETTPDCQSLFSDIELKNNPYFACLFYLSDYLFDVYFKVSQEETNVYLYDYRFFISPEDGGYTFVENAGNTSSENTEDRIISLMPSYLPSYDALMSSVNEHIETIRKYGFYIMQENGNGDIPYNIVFCKSLSMYPKFIEEIQKTFREEIYAFQLPWFPRLYHQNTKQNFLMNHVNCLQQGGKHSQAFSCQFKCSHPNLVMNLLLHKKQLSKTLNNNVTTTRNSQNGVKELYTLFQLLQKNSVSSFDQYLDDLSFYEMEHTNVDIETAEMINDFLDYDLDSDHMYLYINTLYAEEVTCYNLIANYFAYFSDLYSQLPSSADIDEEKCSFIRNSIDTTGDSFLSLYRDTFNTPQLLFFLFMRSFIELQMRQLDSPLLRAYASSKLISDSFSKQGDFLSSDVESAFQQIEHLRTLLSQSLIPTKNYSGLFHAIADKSSLFTILSENHHTTSQLGATNAAFLELMFGRYQHNLFAKYPKLPTVISLLNACPPESDTRLKNLGRRTHGTSGKLNFKRPDKKFDELYQAIRYYVIQNNSYRTKTNDVIEKSGQELAKCFQTNKTLKDILKH